jgi:hypothetical protein
MLLKTGGHEFHRLVTDGNTRSSWIYTSSDPRGQAVVDLLKEGATPEFNTREFRPFWSYCLQNKHAAEPSFSKETATVRAVWEETPTHHYELSLAAWRDMLRPVIIKSIYTNAGSADEIAYECRYVYSSKIGEEGLFYPARIEMLSPAHDICTVLTIREVDFSPTFTDATFQLKGFPAGTLVRDKVKNK